MMRTFILLFSITAFSLSSNSILSQNDKIVITQDVHLTIDEVFNLISKQTSYKFIYHEDLFKNIPKVKLKRGVMKANDLLQYSLSLDEFNFELTANNTIVIKKNPPIEESVQKQQPVTGRVTDEYGGPLLGVNVLLKGTKKGVITDIDGEYKISVPADGVLVFSFLGMKTQEIQIDNQSVVDVVLIEDIASLDNVVVTSFVTRSKESYTGAATTIKGSELLEISNTDIFKAIATLDPAVTVATNNNQGSNPNFIPEIIIRGTTSINASGEVGINSPLIVIDGIESSINALYDIDLFQIESVTILKDASATALYGEQASNGVILVKRKANSQKELRVSYNFTGTMDVADLSDYNLMNASQKLELERLAGLYDNPDGSMDEIYNERLALVNSGVNTDWIAKPVRSAFSQNHSLSVSGRGSGLEYIFSGRYRNNQGVMKDDFRKSYGVGIHLNYNHNDKFIISVVGDIGQVKSQNSKYGSFMDYINANPYDTPYDENGELRTSLSYDRANPLYEASLSSFSESALKTISANVNLRWNIVPGLFATGRATINSNDGRNDVFISPESNAFVGATDKGLYTVNTTNDFNYVANTGLNYIKNLDESGSVITVNLGGEVRRSETDPYGFSATGFFSDKLADLAFASKFTEGSSPSGIPTESSGVAAFAAVNGMYKSRYFFDGSYRTSGSSLFGSNNTFAPFWSVGVGWNMHKEAFLDYDWIDVLRFRASLGHTGSINFSPFQAITTYRYASDLIYGFGNGANPITLGNENLKWETTESYNFGLTSTFLNNRINFNFDIYKKRTFDLIVPVSLTPSTGVTLVLDNVGEQENKGFEATLSGMIVKNQDVNWRMNFTVQQNRTELIEIGNSLRSLNSIRASITQTSAPADLYIEGQSPSMIYTVPSAGIDPATGREIFINKDGQYTYDWNPEDKVAFGDRTPNYLGSISSFARWKNLSLNISSSFSLGGYIYNTTKVERIERIDPSQNADVRAFTERWQKPGDVVNYLSIVANPDGIVNNHHSSRFVEKQNLFSINSINVNYEFPREMSKSFGFSRLSCGLNINEPFRFSTVEIERGIFYPYSRGFTFNLSATL